MGYPLETAARLREEAQRACERGLASSIAALERAEAEVERAVRAREEHARETARTEDAERGRGAVTIDEALRLTDWRRRRNGEASALAAEEARARDAVRSRRRELEDARAALAAARAEVEALEKHRAAWEAEQRVVRERREEAELDDRTSHAHRSGSK